MKTALIALFALSLTLAAAQTPEARDYRIEALDVIRVAVFQEPDLSAEVRVTKEGAAVIPLIGPVRIAGMTADEAAASIARQLQEREILLSPSVTITVLGYTSRSVNVLGAVNQPGTIQLPPEQRFYVLDAITKAGGFSRVADLRKLRVIRRDGKEGGVKVLELNLDRFIRGETDQNILLEAEDVIFVQERNF